MIAALAGEENLTPLAGWRVHGHPVQAFEDCCLIVATYRRPEDIERQMLALRDLPDVPAEVVIVDGASDRETEKTLLDLTARFSFPFELTYVRSPKGLTRQRNVGIDVSTRQYVFFLDDDALPQAGYFAELRRLFREDTRETIGAIGVCALNELNKALPIRWRLRRKLRLVPLNEPFVYNDAGTSAPSGLLKPFSGVRDVDLFPGYAFAVRRQVFEHIRFSGFFDGYSYGEDVEMSLRIKRHWRVLNCGDARVVHNVSPGGRPAAFDKGRMEVRNRYFIWRRYTRHASLLNRVRFHGDFLFLTAMDLAWFAIRPWKVHHLSHALGLLAGLASAATRSLDIREPAVQRRYRLEVAEAAKAGTAK